jgi:Family of unknown function (DUF6459)
MTITALHPAPHRAPEPAAPAARPRLRRVRYEPDPGAAPADPLPVAPPPDPGPVGAGPGVRERQEASREILLVLRVALEVLDRRRPSTQLVPHFAPAPLRCWRVAVMRRQPRSRAQPGRMLLCMPRSGVAEVALPCRMDGRVRALAARFELTAGRWRCTDLRLG